MSIAKRMTADCLAVELEMTERVLAAYRNAPYFTVTAEDDGPRMVLRADEIGLCVYGAVLQRLITLTSRLAAQQWGAP
jgi:hypothetical protein